MSSQINKLQQGVGEVGEWVKKYQEEIILALGVALISLLSFALGYLIAKQQMKEPIRIEEITLVGGGICGGFLRRNGQKHERNGW